MSRAIKKSAVQIQNWIRACKAEGAQMFNETFECVLEKRLDSGARMRDPSRDEGNRIYRAVTRATTGNKSRMGLRR